jgi:hypothetical protein
MPAIIHNYVTTHTRFWIVCWIGFAGWILTWIFIRDTIHPIHLPQALHVPRSRLRFVDAFSSIPWQLW